MGGRRDVPRWCLTWNGDFSVASAWNNSRSRRPIVPALDDIWNEGLTTSMSIFMWRLLSNRIPVDSKLQWRNISLASKCLCCPTQPGVESPQLLFVRSQGACRVWGFFDEWFVGPSDPLRLADTIPTRLEKWAKRTNQSSKTHLARVLPSVICWFLWAERNNCRHNGVRFRAFSVIWQVKMHLQRLVDSGRWRSKHFNGVDLAGLGVVPTNPRGPGQRIIAIKWQPPDPPWLKYNTMGIHIQTSGRAGGGGVFRDHLGTMISAFLTPINARTELEAELETICQALSQAREKGQPVWVEISSPQASTLIRTGEWGPANVRHSLAKLRLLQESCMCKFTLTRRAGNKAAGLLAKLGAEADSRQDLDESTAPRLLRAIVSLEPNGTPYIDTIHEE